MTKNKENETYRTFHHNIYEVILETHNVTWFKYFFNADQCDFYSYETLDESVDDWIIAAG